jgi:hypothetical protein
MSSAPFDLSTAGVSRLSKLVWVAVLGGPAAWALQFLFSIQFGLARCESPNARYQVPVHAISAVLGGAGALIGFLCLLIAIAVFRATSADEHTADPTEIASGRVHFLAAIAITVNPLTAVLCAMVAVGSPLLPLCQQS